jgi:hypothetical protein
MEHYSKGREILGSTATMNKLDVPQQLLVTVQRLLGSFAEGTAAVAAGQCANTAA